VGLPMSAFERSWDLLKATVYRGTAAPFGYPNQPPFNHHKGMQQAYSLEDPGFLTTDRSAAENYAHERLATMEHYYDPDDQPMSVPYVMRFESDLLDDPLQVMREENLTDEQYQMLLNNLGNRLELYPPGYYEDENRFIDSMKDIKDLVGRYVMGLNTPDITDNPTRWEANVEGGYGGVKEWGEEIERAIADLGYSYIGYHDVDDHDTLYSLRRDPSLKLVGRHML